MASWWARGYGAKPIVDMPALTDWIADPGPRHAMGLAWRVFDLGASCIWATSGALLAARRGFDVTGIFAVALVSSTGGGLLRDSLFLQEGPPAVVRTSAYLIIASAAALGVWAFGDRVRGTPAMSGIVMVADALALGAFAVVGMHLSIGAGLSTPAVMLVGVVNAVGGGLLRSVFLHKTPEVFRPGELTALAALLGCVLYLVLTRVFSAGDAVSAACTVVLVAIVRILSVRYRVKTGPARGYVGVDET